MQRHLFKRIVEKNGKKETRWYYWFYDEDGKQVKKSCGKNGKPCLLKREAESYLAELAIKDEQEEKERQEAKKVRLRDVSADMYKEGSVYVKLSRERGKSVTAQTLEIKQHCLEIFLAEFGDRTPDNVDGAEIENWIIDQPYSNSYKNQIIGVIKEVYSECRRYKIVSNVPVVESFKRHSKKKDIFTKKQLQTLFPAEIDKLADVWKSRLTTDVYKGIDGNLHSYGVMFGTMFLFMLSTGLRPGEIRAVQFNQLHNSGLYIDKMFDSKEQLQSHLKKGTVDDPKFRTCLIPANMQEALSTYLNIRPDVDSQFIFTYRGHHVTKSLLEKRFDLGLMNTGIAGKRLHIDEKGRRKNFADKQGKRYTPHSLRFTYNTFVVNSNLLPGEVLRKMIGHNTAEMTDYYTRHDPGAELEGLRNFQSSIDEIWS